VDSSTGPHAGQRPTSFGCGPGHFRTAGVSGAHLGSGCGPGVGADLSSGFGFDADFSCGSSFGAGFGCGCGFGAG
jgi:hypothetical protein